MAAAKLSSPATHRYAARRFMVFFSSDDCLVWEESHRTLRKKLSVFGSNHKIGSKIRFSD